MCTLRQDLEFAAPFSQTHESVPPESILKNILETGEYLSQVQLRKIRGTWIAWKAGIDLPCIIFLGFYHISMQNIPSVCDAKTNDFRSRKLLTEADV